MPTGWEAMSGGAGGGLFIRHVLNQLLTTNAKIVASCAGQSARYSPNACIIVVTNPLDIMAYVAPEASDFHSAG